MKNIILIIAAMFSLNVLAQEGTETKKTEPEDTTRFKVGGLEFIIIDHGDEVDTVLAEGQDIGKDVKVDKDKKKKVDDNLTYWSGFEFGPSILFDKNGGNNIVSPYLELDPAQSFAYSLNLFEKRIPFGTDHVGLVTGLGFTQARYGFKDSYTLTANSDSTWGVLDTTRAFNKNQLRATYLNVPLLLQFNTSKYDSKNFHVAVGVIGGVRINSKTIQKFDVIGKEAKNKEKGIYNLNPFQASATARVGYNDIGLFMNYNLLSLFESGTAEEVYPLTMGISLHF
ncbi:MAG: outer membrane beta-barrel protein [Putridiphycobacter sp.]|nr:outer membrane beta-barrel protein [Putridiphycobacter sp.]